MAEGDDRNERRPRGQVGKRVATAILVGMFLLAAFERLVLSGGARPF